MFSGERLPVFALPQNGDDVYFIRPKKGDAEAVTGRANTLRMNYRVPVDIEPSDLGDVETGDTVKFRVDAPGSGESVRIQVADELRQHGFGSDLRVHVPQHRRPRRDQRGSIDAVAMSSPSRRSPRPSRSRRPRTPAARRHRRIGTGYDLRLGYNYDSGYTPPSDFGCDFDSDTPNPEENFPDAPKDTPEDTTLPEATSGTSVSGELLAATAPLEPSSGGDAAAGGAQKNETTPPEDEVIFEENDEVTAPGALIAAGVVVGLIGLGAGREIEDVRPRRFLRRPNFSGLRRLLPPWK